MLQYMRIRLAAKARTDRGATAVEYGLLVALIAAAIVAIVATLGQEVLKGFTDVSEKLPDATTGGGGGGGSTT